MHDMVSSMECNTCGMLNEVERRMYERESHLMSEIETRTQEDVRAQVTRQREEIQSQVSEMERRLKDEFFSRIESIAEAIRPAYGTLPAVTSIESGVNECMHGVNDASERFVPRVVGSLCSTEVSTAPLIAENPVGNDVATSVVDNTYSTQPPPRSGRGSWECERAAIVEILGLVESSVESSIGKRQQCEHETQISVCVRRNEGPQEQEEAPEMMVTGKTVPHTVPGGVRSSDSQLLSCVNVRVNESTQVASMEHGDDNF